MAKLLCSLFAAAAFACALVQFVHNLARPASIFPIVTRRATNADNKPQLAWLLSFPNSGTTYTQNLVQSITQTTTGTNYGSFFQDHTGKTKERQYESKKIFSEHVNGPFRFSTFPLPPTFILTKTHCVGWAWEAPPHRYLFSKRDFLQGCQRTESFTFEAKAQPSSYDIGQLPVGKIVHLVRDPFDNIVSRYRYQHHQKTHLERDPDFRYGNDPGGFQRYCHDTDPRWRDEEAKWYSPEVLALSESVPCHADFYRLVQWHNNAFWLATELNVPELVLHYGAYGSHFDKVVDTLLSFLELDKVGAAPVFRWHHYAGTHFTPEQRRAVKAFVFELSSETTWEHLRGYFNGIEEIQ